MKAIRIFALFLVFLAACASFFPFVKVEVADDPIPTFSFWKMNNYFVYKPFPIEWIIIVDPETYDIIWDIRGKPQVVEHLKLGEVPNGFCEVIPFKASLLKEGHEYVLYVPNYQIMRGNVGEGKKFTYRGKQAKE